MIIVHHLEQSRSQRILWLLEELGAAYDVRHYKRDPETNLAPPELRQVHPLGKSPVIQDNDHIIAETGAIVEYLIDHYGEGRLKPQAGTQAYQRYNYWLHYAEGSLMPPLLLKLVMTRMAEAPMPFFVRPIAKQLTSKVSEAFINPNMKAHFDFVEQELGKSDWLAGPDLTGADIMMSFPLEAAAARSGQAENRPNLQTYLARIHARPAYQKALDVGGPYDYGPQDG